MDYPSSRITYIYALTGSDHIDVKYIGKSNDPKGRLKQHIYNAKKAKIPTYKQKWIRKLLKNGHDIECIVLEVCPLSNFVECETKWIKYFKEHNHKITNSDDTGQGNIGRKKEIIDRASMKISKKVYQYDLNGNFIKEYKSAREAGRALGKSHGNISKCCKGIFKHTAGFIFRYEKCEDIDCLEKPNAVRKKVVELCDKGNIIGEWDSICECSRETNINNGHISRCCNNKLKHIKGRYFQFK